MWTILLGLIPGLFSTISGITSAISNEKIALINAQTDQERIQIQERINVLQTQRDVLVADSNHSKLDLWIRSAIALGPTAYLLKIFIWDKVLALGSTDALDTNLWQVMMAVIGFYFLYSGAIGVAKIIKA